ncbi:Usherin, partial [Colius striatus]
CQCYSHAVSCHYDLAMDTFPQEHYRGSGGVCDNCQHNTSGLRCDSCSFGFKTLRYSNEDGCEPCWCNSHGSVNQFCNPLSGQCNCKEQVKGLHCDTCMDHFYG